MKKEIKNIYYSEYLPQLSIYSEQLGEAIPCGLCNFISDTKFWSYLNDYIGTSKEKCFFLAPIGKWTDERLNLVCLLIHSLDLDE